ncbi:MAG TPA: class I SAM-dependent methyltransferase [Flavobacterium sp.]|jgi:ubiquinone/menaquinone biosynthesis C-methylase UbiE
MKDYFSKQAAQYAKYRPSYPQEMIEYIISFCANRETALDVATGNGQVAVMLSSHFDKVFATDISEKQLASAARVPNLTYLKEPAEQTSFEDNAFDLVLVAQAVHWFDFDKFYEEVRRILKPDGIFAIVGYVLFKSNPDSDKIVHRLYDDIVGPYWHPERKYLDENYKTIPFPFEEIPVREFGNELEWSYEQVMGYLDTWSATQNYKNKNNENPLDLIREELRESWERNNKKVTFPLLLRIGKIPSDI